MYQNSEYYEKVCSKTRIYNVKESKKNKTKKKQVHITFYLTLRITY